MRKQIQLLSFVGLMLVLFVAKPTFATCGGGYTDSLGSYFWFSEQKDSVLHVGGRNWYLISQEKAYWEEALIIRRANLEALLSLGFDSSMVMRDLCLFPGNSTLFSKHCYLLNSKRYIEKWEAAFNSENLTTTAMKSKEIIIKGEKTNLVLKHYPAKGGMDTTSALGLVQKDFLSHSVEAGLEIFEFILMKIAKEKDSQREYLYDAHLRNAAKVLKVGNINFEDLMA